MLSAIEDRRSVVNASGEFKMLAKSKLAVVMFLLTTTCAAPLCAQQVPDSALQGLKWRLVGPFRGGRVEAVAGLPGQPNIYYMGTVAGGVWITTDGGISWDPIFDEEKVASVGAIAIAPSDPNVIYVGTGEPCIRGDSSYGDGVYRSNDGGKHWTHIGLLDSRHIGRIIIDPQNPDIALVAAVGHTYGPNSERGVFRTTDGGKNWQKVLYKDENSGAIDLSMDAHNPRIIFAALWQVRRTPWSLVSGGPGSGLYRSADSGQTWQKIEGRGLPSGTWGRVGVSVSPADTNRIYALIEAEEGGLFRSDDGGEAWTRINGDYDLRGRPWYYTHVFAHPHNPDGVFVFSFEAYRSSDGGKSFKRIQTPHGDYHAMWIDPSNSERMIVGNDGGATISIDGGRRWTPEDNQPTGQFYHVAADNQFNYHLYGSQQDEGTTAIASRTNHGTIGPSDWHSVGGGESGFVVPSPMDPNIVYAGSLYSTFTRFDQRTEQAENISPWPINLLNQPAEKVKYRFGWTAPLVVSPHDPHVLLIGAQLVLKTTDEGKTWAEISPDLTRNDKSKQKSSGGSITQDNTTVEYFDQIAALAESPLEKGTIWAGTDDGLIQLSQNNGKSWVNVTPKEIPEWSMVSVIDPSPHDFHAAYVAVDAHRLDDFRPYIYKTADSGKTWKRIAKGIPEGNYVHAVREDPVRRGLLFAGTERGVYISFDDGEHWQSLQRNLPVTPIYDLLVHGNDLAVATHGRAFWILDDIAPLHEINDDTLGGTLRLFKPTIGYRGVSAGTGNPGSRSSAGNPPGGVAIDYFLKETPKAQLKLEIRDEHGKIVRSFTLPASASDKEQQDADQVVLPGKPGMNRFYWDLSADFGDASSKNNDEDFSGAPNTAVPGNYDVKLTLGEQSQTQKLEIKSDPRRKVDIADLQRDEDWKKALDEQLSIARKAVKEMRSLDAQLNALDARLKEIPNAKEVVAAGEALDKKTIAAMESVTGWKIKPNRYSLNYPPAIDDSLGSLQYNYGGSDGALNQPAFAVLADLKKQLDTALSAWREIKRKDLPAFNELVKNNNISAVMLSEEHEEGHR
jgi:photosystem II stability/assembly factor-like uncharacterized protein